MAQIYKATYSGVPVYEFPCKGVAVMRRMLDGWVNATHILKVSGFDKPQRTKILERDVQKGVHEKVQGGYGKYQGTWVPLERAREIASEYKVDGDLALLFDYQPSENSPPPAPKHSGAAAKAKAARSASDLDGSGVGPAAKRARKSATMPNLHGALEPEAKKRRGRPPNSTKLAQQAATAAAAAAAHHSHQAPLSTVRSQMSPVGPGGTPTAATPTGSVTAGGIGGAGGTGGGAGGDEYSVVDSASVSSRSSSPSEFMSDSDLDAALNNGYGNALGSARKLGTPRDGRHQQHFMDSGFMAADYSSRLLNFFMAPDDEHIPDFVTRPPPGFKINQVIDDEGHTAFHWSCAMGILKIIEVLINIGADISAVNLMGHTPLMRSIMYTNNYDRRTFPRVVELLRDTIFHVDLNRRTVLHHIANTAASRSKLSSARYYLEILLAKVSESQPPQDVVRFLDRQDESGDTALHIVARKGARKCAKVLLSYHASVDIPNKRGETAYMLIYPDEALRPFLQKDNSHYQHQHLANFNSSSSPVQGSQLSSGTITGNNHNTLSTPTAPRTRGNAAAALARTPGSFGSAVPNGQGLVANPHLSETAIRATQQVAPAISDQLEALANAYDTELREKDWDLHQVQQLLSDIKAEVTSTDQAIKDLESQLGDEASIEARKDELVRVVNLRNAQLNKLLERSQSRDLAQLVQEEETKVKDQLGSAQFDVQECTQLAEELANLQTERRRLVEQVSQLYESAGIGAKMNDYRRLVATSCGVKFEEIDNLLDGIAQALTENNDEGIEDEIPDQPVGFMNGQQLVSTNI